MLGKKVRGQDYAEDLDTYEKKKKKKLAESSKTAGMAKALKKSQSKTGYSDKPRVKGPGKVKIDLKKGKVY